MLKYLFLFFITISLSTSLAQAQDSTNYCLRSSSFHVVVIGSSTASGSGASTYDSAWVNRYRNYIQGINPANTVTNLAIGGTNTYHIMPSWFVAPSNRPAHNNNNITQAILLGADAIIVNMPSNDAASGYGVDEQMFNFHTVVQTADSFNIPVWICTTQPKANFPLAKDSIQVAVKDSVISAFGSFTVDFWSTIALANNKLDSTYDSGDGTHLNDVGHGLLFTRVRDKNILSHLYVPSVNTDHVLLEYAFLPGSSCGDTMTTLQGVVSNTGPATTGNLIIKTHVYDQVYNQNYILYDTLTGGLNTCETDTFQFIFNTWGGAKMQLSSVLQSNDINLSNDSSSQISLFHAGRPSFLPFTDTVCANNIAHLQAISYENIFWYASQTSTTPIASGFNFYTDPLQQTSTYWVESVRLPLYYNSSLQAASTGNINWNGVMFNIIAKDTMTIDSLSFYSPDLGLQGIVARYHTGGYQGVEDSASAWTIWGADAKQITNATTLYYADFGTMTLYPNDTLGVYLSMLNASARLAYQSGSSGAIFSNSELEIECGSGIGYNFSAIYPNRKWRGGVFYHFGYNPQGKCSSKREPIEAYVDVPHVDLGTDSIYQQQNTTLNLDAGAGFSEYLWSTGDTTQTLSIVLNNDWLNYNLLMVQVKSKFGCVASDTMVIYVLPTSITEFESKQFSIYPNPASDFIYCQIDKESLQDELTLNLYNSSGGLVKKMRSHKNESLFKFPIHEIANGIYYLELGNSDGKIASEKIIITK